MSSDKEDIVAQLNEGNYTNVLEDSNVDDIADEMKLMCDIESEEYRWQISWFITEFIRTSINCSDDDAIFQPSRILQSSTATNSISTIQARDSDDPREEESEEYR